MSQEALGRFGEELLIAATGGIAKKGSTGEVRVIYDGTNGIFLNYGIKIRDQMQFPGAPDIKAELAEMHDEGGSHVSILFDVIHFAGLPSFSNMTPGESWGSTLWVFIFALKPIIDGMKPVIDDFKQFKLSTSSSKGLSQWQDRCYDYYPSNQRLLEQEYVEEQVWQCEHQKMVGSPFHQPVELLQHEKMQEQVFQL